MERNENERGRGNAFESVRRYAREHPWAALAAAGGVVAALGASGAARRVASGGGARIGEIAREMTRSGVAELSHRMKGYGGSIPRLGYYRGASMVGKGPQLP